MKLSGSRHHYLGIAIGERSITVAEVAPRHGVSSAAPGVPAWEVRRAAEFVPPPATEGATDEQTSAATGAALAKFLRDNGFGGGAGRAVVGVPARWLVAREREIPPTTPEQASEILRLQAERMFSAELGELTVDYAGQADPNNARGVLVVAMPNKQLRRVVSIVEAAGKQVTAVMPSTLALADAVAVAAVGANGDHDGIVLSLSGDAVELSAHRGGSPKVLRHLPVRGPDLASNNGTRESAMTMLAGEIRRTVAMMPRGVAGPGVAQSSEGLHVLDGIGLDARDAATLAQQAGVDLRGGTGAATLSALGVASSAGGAEARFAPALALALSGALHRPGAVDFLHPRLAEPKKSRFGRREAWAVFIALACLLALGALYYDVKHTESQIAEIRADLQTKAPLLAEAEETAAHVGTARGWFAEGRPPVLECLRDITSMFPDGGEAIYFTKLTLPESRQGRATGKAPDRDLVYDLIDRMNASKLFTNVKGDYTLAAGAQSKEVAFSISFTYVGTGANAYTAGAAAAAAKTPAAAGSGARK
jgi:Tfp pilus assembly PilM family ATPase